jgi:alpha-amylase
MSVSLIGWGRFFDKEGNRITVPAPPTDPGKPWLWDFLASQAHELAQIGFDRIQLPPSSKAQGGAGAGCDGYGVYHPRDIGNLDQQGSIPTRYGSAEQLRRLIAVAHQNGLEVDLDIVLHQLIGGINKTYRYKAWDGSLTGRGLMDPGCFRSAKIRDDVPDPADDFAFGDEKLYQRCNPPGYTIKDALDYGEWLFHTTGADGSRFDDTKGAWPPFVAQFMNHAVMGGKQFYSEYFDGNPANLNWWATSNPMNSRSGVEDFTVHFAIVNACNNFNAASLTGGGYFSWRPDLAYGFVDNPDTDTSSGEGVISCKLLGYAYLLTIPCRSVLVYGKDYYTPQIWPGAYGLKRWIDNLVYINRTFAYGDCITRWADDKVVVLERDGDGGAVGNSPGLLTCLNFDTWNRRTITCATSFGANTHLHDYTGHHPDIWTDWNGNATFTIPSNAFANGQSYLCFSRANSDKPIKIKAQKNTQTFYGAADLDIPPVSAAKDAVAGRIYARANSKVSFSTKDPVTPLLMNGHGPIKNNQIEEDGWYTVTVQTESEKAIPFALDVTYEAPALL